MKKTLAQAGRSSRSLSHSSPQHAVATTTAAATARPHGTEATRRHRAHRRHRRHPTAAPHRRRPSDFGGANGHDHRPRARRSVGRARSTTRSQAFGDTVGITSRSPATPTGKPTSTPRSRAATRRTSASSRSPASSPDFAAAGSILPLDRRGRRRRRRELGRRTTQTTARSSTASSTACPSRPTSSRSCGTCRAAFEAAGYEVPTTFDEFTALIDQIKADGDAQATVRRHRVRRRHRLAVHRLDRGDGAPPGRRRRLRPVGAATRSRSTIRRSSTAMQTVLDLWSEDNVFAAAASIAATTSGQRPAAARRRVLHAPPGVVLRRLVPRGHDVRRRVRGCRSTSSTSRTSTATSRC